MRSHRSRSRLHVSSHATVRSTWARHASIPQTNHHTVTHTSSSALPSLGRWRCTCHRFVHTNPGPGLLAPSCVPALVSLPCTQVPRGSGGVVNPSLPIPAVAIDLVGVERPQREALEQGPLFTLPDAPGTGSHVTRWRPGEQRPHRVHLAVEGGRRLQHVDELRVVRPHALL